MRHMSKDERMLLYQVNWKQQKQKLVQPKSSVLEKCISNCRFQNDLQCWKNWRPTHPERLRLPHYMIIFSSYLHWFISWMFFLKTAFISFHSHTMTNLSRQLSRHEISTRWKWDFTFRNTLALYFCDDNLNFKTIWCPLKYTWKMKK